MAVRLSLLHALRHRCIHNSHGDRQICYVHPIDDRAQFDRANRFVWYVVAIAAMHFRCSLRRRLVEPVTNKRARLDCFWSAHQAMVSVAQAAETVTISHYSLERALDASAVAALVWARIYAQFPNHRFGVALVLDMAFLWPVALYSLLIHRVRRTKLHALCPK